MVIPIPKILKLVSECSFKFASAHFRCVVLLLPSAVRRHQAMAGKLMVAEQSQTVRMSAAARESDILVG